MDKTFFKSVAIGVVAFVLGTITLDQLRQQDWWNI